MHLKGSLITNVFTEVRLIRVDWVLTLGLDPGQHESRTHRLPPSAAARLVACRSERKRGAQAQASPLLRRVQPLRISKLGWWEAPPRLYLSWVQGRRDGSRGRGWHSGPAWLLVVSMGQSRRKGRAVAQQAGNHRRSDVTYFSPSPWFLHKTEMLGSA